MELTGADLREVVQRYKEVYRSQGKALPDDPQEQLRLAISAVFGSWNTPRAVKYRRAPPPTQTHALARRLRWFSPGAPACVHGHTRRSSKHASPAAAACCCCCREINRIHGLLGTAVNVQAMVYGNLNDNSGTGGWAGGAECTGARSQHNLTAC